MATALAKPNNDRLSALKLVQSSRTAWRLANVLLVMLGIAILAMFFVPWQQSARGTGKVVAFVPQERQQMVTSPVKGLVLKIRDGLVEGARVKRDELLIEIEPKAANLVQQLSASIADIDAKLRTANMKAEVYGRNVVDFAAAKVAAVKAADEMVENAKAKYDAKLKLVSAYEAKELQARQNYERQKGLLAQGLRSPKEVEKLLKDWNVAIAELASVKLDVVAANDEFEAKQSERVQKEREAETKVAYARAMQQDALGMAAAATKERREVEIKLDELDRLNIRAPRDGTIFRLNVFERGQLIKEDEELFTIVPDTTDRAVELWVAGNDTPLIHAGDHVRLQFEGWPAVQFAGWPSVAVGTFGGEVFSVDATDDGTGKFRILVKPKSKSEWPEDRYLRQGVRTNGWVMLQQVPLGYEIWRQLNGFPASISKAKTGEKEDKAKKPKLPK